VRDLALRLARAEGADLETVEIAALLHDIGDEKVSGDPLGPGKAAQTFLESYAVYQDLITHICAIVDAISFHGSGVADPPTDLEGLCVRDADRLDAMGAIGIARAFAYGGHLGRPIYDPDQAAVEADSLAAYRAGGRSTINHFAEKLLRLAARMGTDSGRALAVERQKFMLDFLERFAAQRLPTLRALAAVRRLSSFKLLFRNIRLTFQPSSTTSARECASVAE
jgi:uncharacterized protein